MAGNRLRKFFSRRSQTRAHRIDVQAKGSRDVRRAHPFQFDENEHDTLVFVEFIEDRLGEVRSLLTKSGVRRRRRRRAELVGLQARVLSRSLPRTLPSVDQSDVVEDPVDPTLQGRPSLEVSETAMDDDEDVLTHVVEGRLGHPESPTHPPDEREIRPVDRRAVSAIDRLGYRARRKAIETHRLGGVGSGADPCDNRTAVWGDLGYRRGGGG